MRTKTLLKLAVPALLLVAGGASAQIANTDHDLSSSGGNICVFCHTPHNANPDDTVPLWNRDTTTTTFTMYDSPTMDMTVAGSPQGSSLACLSCHDGTIATDQLYGGTGDPAKKLTGDKNLGANLDDDHPISITYATTGANGDTAFNDAVSGTLGGGSLPLFGTSSDQVECATCHSVHDETIGKFLRMDNGGSAMCLACHIK